MRQISFQDLSNLLNAIAELNSELSPATLPSRGLRMVRALVQSECSSFDFFSGNDRYNTTPWTDRPDVSTPENMQIFARYVQQHALIPIALAKKDGQALKMTDVLAQAEFERSELYNEFYRRHGFNRQMGLAMPVTSDLTVSCVVTGSGTDFTERDRTMLTLAAPHLLNAMRNSLAYERVSSALGSVRSGVISMDRAGTVQFVSDFAEALLERYFPDQPISRGLPQALRDTLTHQPDRETLRPATSIKVEGPDGVLSVRPMSATATGELTLVLEERTTKPNIRFDRYGLTSREGEILFWILNGKTNPEIAIICDLSPRTVHKHVEHIYQKLGVESRTAAMLLAMELF